MPRDLTAAERGKLPSEIRAVGSAARITAADDQPGDDGKPKLGTFAGNAYTGVAMEPGGWYGSIICDLAGVRVPMQHRPVLRQHDDNRIVGHTTEVNVTDAGIEIAGVFSGAANLVADVTTLAKNGFQWQLSIGAVPVRTEFLEAGESTEVNGRTVYGPLTISRETELKEISFVPLGADGNTSVNVSASRGRGSMFKAMLLAAKKGGGVKAGKYSDEDIDKMSEDDAKSALKKCMDDDKADAADDDKDKADDKKDDEAKASAHRFVAEQRKAFAAEAKRIADIQAKAAELKLPAVRAAALSAQAIGDGWTADRFELEATREAIKELRAGRPGPGVGGPHLHVPGDPRDNITPEVIEAATLYAFRHQLQLEDDDFYFDLAPDQKTRIRRVPQHLQAEAQKDFRTKYTDQVRQTAHDLFANESHPRYISRFGMKPLLEISARAAGIGGRLDLSGRTGVEGYLSAWADNDKRIRAEGASAMSLSNILANVMNKFALQGYLFVEQAWREVFGIRPVNDFKPTKSVGLLGDVMYKVIGPSGEIENASLGDQAFANQAQPYARMLTIPWTNIVNDDLSVLQTVPQKMGQGAGTAINDSCWTLIKNMFAGSVNGDDGNAFFRTTSLTTAAANKAGTAYKANKMSGGSSAFGDTALQTAKALFDNQIDPNGNPLGFDGLTPILLHGPTLWRPVTAQMQAPAIVYGGGSAALAPNVNPWQGMMRPVMSRYMESANYVNSATAWGLFFNPIALAVAEIAFLNGVDTPAVLQAGPDYQFDRLGISIRGSIAFGTSQQNFRGGVYAVGA